MNIQIRNEIVEQNIIHRVVWNESWPTLQFNVPRDWISQVTGFNHICNEDIHGRQDIIP